MGSRLLNVLTVLFICAASSAAFGQLGLKDGAGLNATDPGRIKVGEQAPDFTLENLDGKRVSLSEFRQKKNVVLVFYRGHW